jgi:hypothetical protein
LFLRLYVNGNEVGYTRDRLAGNDANVSHRHTSSISKSW